VFKKPKIELFAMLKVKCLNAKSVVITFHCK